MGSGFATLSFSLIESTSSGRLFSIIFIDRINVELDVDTINENDSVANPDPTPRIASVHKSRFAEVVLNTDASISFAESRFVKG